MLSDGTNILLTGVTGLIGGEVLRTLLRCPGGRVWTLARATPDHTPQARVLERLHRSGDPATTLPPRVTAVAGDMTLPHLGLSAEDLRDITQNVDIIIHSAAETSFVRDAACRETNVLGATHLIALARQCVRRPRVMHISTAYVSGIVQNACLKEDNELGQDHHNGYTRSKAEAEALFFESDLDVLVVRPSVVLSADLPDVRFARAILQFVPLAFAFDAVPVDPAARPDAVPVQFVADSIVRLLERSALRHRCYHISAGDEGTAGYGELAALVDQFYGRATPLQLVPPSQWTRHLHREQINTPARRKLFAKLRNYLPFLNMNVLYDNGRLREELGDRFPDLPPLTAYVESLLRLVTPEHATQWLRRGRARATAI